MRTPCLTVTLSLALALVAHGADRWESGNGANDDSPDFTFSELVHGTVQWGHDLDGSPDIDWMITQVRARHSYEARVRSATLSWDGPTCANNCVSFDRVDAGGSVLTPGLFDGAPTGNGAVYRATKTVRWIAAADGKDYLRATGGLQPLNATDQYDLEFYDTTYFAPRFNNSGTQITILIVQNARNEAVSGSVYFYNAAGTLLHTEPMNLLAQGSLVLNTAGIPALQGQAGSLAIAHTGGYGALTGKAVALEPATGFTFDTALSPVPR